MAFEKEKIYYNNHLRKVRLGNDGTAYATCAEAVADVDDPYKVRGDIILTDDIPNISDLEGTGIVFDATKNEYRITDSEALLTRLGGLALFPDQEQVRGSVIVGSYLYLGLFTAPGIIVKIDLTDFSYVDYTLLNSGEDDIASLIADETGTYLYAGCFTSPGNVVQINIASFSRSNGLTLASGENQAYALATSGSFLYAGCFTTAGKVARIDLTTFTQSGTTVTLAAGENQVASLALSGDYLYCGLYTTNGKVARIYLGTFLQSGTTVTLAAGEDYVISLDISGNYLYCGLETTAGKVARIDLTTFLQSGTTVTLAAGENIVATLSNDGTYVYCGCNVSPGKVARIDIATFLQSGTTVTLATGENYVNALAISGSYLYCGLNVSPGKVARIDLATFLQSGTTVTLAAGENQVRALAISGSYLYAGCFTSPGKVARIDLATFIQSGTTVTLAGGENQIVSLHISGSYLYAGCFTTAGKVARIDLETFLQSGTTVTLAAGENEVMALSSYSDFLYCGLNTLSGKVARIQISTFLQNGTTVTLAAGENYVRSLANDGIYIYCGLYLAPGKVARILISTFLQNGTTVTLATGEDYVMGLALFDNYLLCGLYTNPGKVARINTTTFLQDDVTITLNTGEKLILSLVVSDEYVFVGNETAPGYVQKIDPYRNFTLFERLQTQDIGDSFTVRAGLTCAQSDPLRPIDLIADTNGTPMAKHLDNTAVSIRAHAPNFVEDGGFESGGVTEWSVGANWAIESTDELEGLYSVAWNTAADNNLTQAITETLKKGTTYRCIFKAATLTGNASAGVLTFQIKQAGSGTDVDTLSGNAPAITTTPTWYGFDIVPDFETNNWELRLVPALAQKGTATSVIVDEIYIYEKKTINSLLVKNHNWSGQGTIVVNAWRVSPFRSTATVDANNKTQLASFTVDGSDTLLQALTETNYPIIEITFSAVSGWVAEAGEIYVGDYWEVPRYPQSFDPYRVNAGNLREVTLERSQLVPVLRTTTIADIFEKLQAGESIWWKWHDNKPLMVESIRTERNAPYSPHRVSTQMRLVEKL